jgi:hypothetical protein
VDDAKDLDMGLKPDHKLSLALNGEMALQIAAPYIAGPICCLI